MQRYVAENPIKPPQRIAGAEMSAPVAPTGLPNPGLFVDPKQLQASKFTGGKCPKCGVHTDTYINPVNNLGKCKMCGVSLMVTDKGLTAFSRLKTDEGNAYLGVCVYWWHGGTRRCEICKVEGKKDVPAYCGKNGFINPAAVTLLRRL